MGIEFRESSMIISSKTEVVAKKGMVFNVCVGLSDLTNSEAKDKEAKSYALFVGDTVVVNEGEPASLLTQLKKRVKHVSVFLKVGGGVGARLSVANCIVKCKLLLILKVLNYY